MNPIRQAAEGLVQRWVDQGLIPSFRFLMRDDVEMVIRQELETALAEADLMRAAAVEDAVRDLRIEAAVLARSWGKALPRPGGRRDRLADAILALGAAPKKGTDEKQRQPEADERTAEAVPEREPPAVRADAEPNADDGRG